MINTMLGRLEGDFVMMFAQPVNEAAAAVNPNPFKNCRRVWVLTIFVSLQLYDNYL